MSRLSAVDKSRLAEWRSMPASQVLVRLADHAKADREYTPTNWPDSTRWHASVAGTEFELICTGARFYDTRARVGGGGAVDLAMLLTGSSFNDAVNFLRSKGL
jgi:hypothetical protein